MIDELNDLIETVSYKINYDACDYEMSMKLFSSQMSEGSVEERVQSAFTEKVLITNVETGWL